MMDITDRLLHDAIHLEGLKPETKKRTRSSRLMRYAATEITQLRAELAAYESALEEIATYDTGATAGLAYTAQQALDTRRNK